MSIGRALAALGYGLKGYTDGLDEVEQANYVRKERARVDKERADADALKIGLAETQKPIEARALPTMVDLMGPPSEDLNIVGPRADLAGVGPQQVAPSFIAGGKTFTTMAEASKAADLYNTDEARARRGADFYASKGEADKGLSLRAAANSLKASDMQIKATEKAETNADKYRALATRLSQATPEQIPEIYKDYNDGMTATVQADGKGGFTLTQLDKNGKPVGSKAYGSMLEFSEDAVTQFDPTKWLPTQQKRAHDKRDQANKERELTVKEKEAASKAELRTSQAETASLRALIAQDKAAAAAPKAGVTQADLSTINKGLFKDASDYLNVKESGTPAERQAALVEATTLANVGTNIYLRAHGMGVPIVQSEALTAARLAGDNKNLVGRPGADGQIYTGVMVSGKFIPTGGTVSKPPSVTPVTPPAPKPVATMAQAAAPAPVQVDPMKAKYMAESSALNKGQILDFSPEVKAYIATQKTQKEAADKAGSQSYLEAERQKALATARAYR